MEGIGRQGLERRTVGGFATCKLSVDCRVSSLPRQPLDPRWPPLSPPHSRPSAPPSPCRSSLGSGEPRTLSVSSVETLLCVRDLRDLTRLYTRPLGEIGCSATPRPGARCLLPRAAKVAASRSGGQPAGRVHDAVTEERARHFVAARLCGCCAACSCSQEAARACDATAGCRDVQWSSAAGGCVACGVRIASGHGIVTPSSDREGEGVGAARAAWQSVVARSRAQQRRASAGRSKSSAAWHAISATGGHARGPPAWGDERPHLMALLSADYHTGLHWRLHLHQRAEPVLVRPGQDRQHRDASCHGPLVVRQARGRVRQPVVGQRRAATSMNS